MQQSFHYWETRKTNTQLITLQTSTSFHLLSLDRGDQEFFQRILHRYYWIAMLEARPSQIKQNVSKIKLRGNQKSNLHYTRDIAAKRITNGVAHLDDLRARTTQHQRNAAAMRAAGDTRSDLIGPGIEPQTLPHQCA